MWGHEYIDNKSHPVPPAAICQPVHEDLLLLFNETEEDSVNSKDLTLNLCFQIAAKVSRAIDTHREYRISYWDALIVSAAERAKCTKIVTEDLKDGGTYHGIVVLNPFKSIDRRQ